MFKVMLVLYAIVVLVVAKYYQMQKNMDLLMQLTHLTTFVKSMKRIVVGAKNVLRFARWRQSL